MLHDNTHPHKASTVQDMTHYMPWKVLDHPPYSLDLSLCDFHVYGPFRAVDSVGQRYEGHNGAAVPAAAQQFFVEGIHQLCINGDTCLNAHGNYFK
jgi:hypothetical protein